MGTDTKLTKNEMVFCAILIAILVVSLIITTREQVTHWKDGITLFKHAVSVTDNNYLAYYNLAQAQLKEGLLIEPINNLKMAIEAKPDFFWAHINMGNALSLAGNYKKSIIHYEIAIKINPLSAAAHNNLGISLKDLGELEKAIEHFKEAIKLNPNK